jgi:hypothetical protein
MNPNASRLVDPQAASANRASHGRLTHSHFGPLREFVLNNSDYVNHTVLTRRLHSYLRWRNANARDPQVLRLLRKRRAEIRAEKQRRWGRPPPRAA